MSLMFDASSLIVITWKRPKAGGDMTAVWAAVNSGNFLERFH